MQLLWNTLHDQSTFSFYFTCTERALHMCSGCTCACIDSLECSSQACNSEVKGSIGVFLQSMKTRTPTGQTYIDLNCIDLNSVDLNCIDQNPIGCVMSNGVDIKMWQIVFRAQKGVGPECICDLLLCYKPNIWRRSQYYYPWSML